MKKYRWIYDLYKINLSKILWGEIYGSLLTHKVFNEGQPEGVAKAT